MIEWRACILSPAALLGAVTVHVMRRWQGWPVLAAIDLTTGAGAPEDSVDRARGGWPARNRDAFRISGMTIRIAGTTPEDRCLRDGSAVTLNFCPANSDLHDNPTAERRRS